MKMMPYPLAFKPRALFRGRSQVQPPTGALLHQRYARAVLTYVVTRLGQGAEADDTTAEVFAAALARLDRCPPPADEGAQDDPARAWMIGIARRKVADVLRRRARRPEEALPSVLPADPTALPEAQTLAAEAAQQLRAILALLPDDQREALLLKYVDGLSLGELGLVLGRSPSAASQLLYRAREAVRRRGSRYFSMEDSQ